MSRGQLMLKARDHWDQWLPKRVAELRKEGRLTEALLGAATLAQDEIDHLMSLGYRQWEAEEVALHNHILLKPERGVTGESPELKAESAARERAYQADPPWQAVPDEEEERPPLNPNP